MLYVAADKYLKPKGKLGFVITQTIFKTEGGGAGFRRLKLGDGDPLRVIQVDDFSDIQCFEGAVNRTSVVIIQKGEAMRFPLHAYNFWRKRKAGANVATEADHAEVMGILTYSQWSARPIQTDNPTSPWITGRRGAIAHIDNAVGKSAYRGREGSNTGGLNGALWVQIVSTRPDGNLLISNLHDIGKIKVKNVTMPVEPDLVFPLLRGRDVERWKAQPECSILVPQDPEQPSRGYPVKDIQTKLPKTYAYLLIFEEQLRKRSGFRQFFKPDLDPFYSIYNVGPYTFTPFKVVWREQSSVLTAAVVEAPKVGNVVIPDHKLMLCPCDTAAEAHYVCALLNSSPAQFIVKSYAIETSISTHVLDHVRIPKFDPNEKLHVGLAESSATCHTAAPSATDAELTALETANDELAARLWNLSAVELKDIRESLRDLQ